MVSAMRLTWIALIAALSAHSSVSETYYIDSLHGSDSNTGTIESVPWQTLAKVNQTRFRPGDRILFHAGSSWREQLAPISSGSERHPILFDRYGAGPMPTIAGSGVAQDSVLLKNLEQIEIHHLAITNDGDAPTVRRGVHIVLDNYGTAHHVVAADLYIHDVKGTNDEKDNGGIVFRTRGDKKPSRFDGLTIERNIVWKVDRSAIVADSYHAERNHWFPSLHVVIRDNYVDDIGGDGIVPWATDGALVEHNIARRCRQRSTDYNAGIWQWSTDNTMLRLNEASETRGTRDGEGFDSDYNSRNTHIEYNYSHDNDGGFLLICTPGKRDANWNIGNIGTVVRFNISRNDRARLINLSAAENVLVEKNAFYVGSGRDVQLLVSDWQGWARKALFRKNSFVVEDGVLRFGHAESRRDDGTYGLASGWGPAKEIVFIGNRYYGKVVTPPPDRDNSTLSENTRADLNMDWHGPSFDPSQPEEFPTYLAAHRAWILDLFRQQFDRVVR